MKRIKKGWKKLRYWQKLGIIGGIFNVMFLNLVITGVMHPLLAIVFLQFPTALAVTIINELFFADNHIPIQHFSQYNWMKGYLLGTATWSFIGMTIGVFIDLIINLRGDKK